MSALWHEEIVDKIVRDMCGCEGGLYYFDVAIKVGMGALTGKRSVRRALRVDDKRSYLSARHDICLMLAGSEMQHITASYLSLLGYCRPSKRCHSSFVCSIYNHKPTQ